MVQATRLTEPDDDLPSTPLGETMSSTIRRPGTRAARAGFIAAPFLGLAVAVALVWQSSYAAFSAQTDNGVNNWTAGTIALSDNDANSAMFNVTGLKPSDTGTRCIQVSKTGDLAGTVKLYGSGLTTTNVLSSNLQLTVTQGGGGSTGGNCNTFTPLATGANVYTGTLAGFTATNFAGGYGTWVTPVGSQDRTYQFTYTLNANTPNEAMGQTAGVRFWWEAQNS
jgi:hypothetical protein